MRLCITDFLLSAFVLVGACAAESASPGTPRPSIEDVVVVATASNVLAALVTARVDHADSVAVRFHLNEAANFADSVTAAVEPGTQARIPVLGLLPNHSYEFRVTAFSGAGVTEAPPAYFTTAALPDDLPTYVASGDGASPGFTALAAGKYGIVIDNTGRVVWYHRFTNGLWLNFMAQPNGRYVARQVTPEPTDVESWVEIDPLGNITRTLGCGLGLAPRFHDLLVTEDGDYWILCDETRTMDLQSIGGVAGARVTGQAVQHISASGELLFHWTPFDHFLVWDVEPASRQGTDVNWTHANSLDRDADGNIIVSFRNLNEITKIDTKSGAVRWRLGGRANQLGFPSGTPAFSGQHSVRVLPSGELLLLDNLGDSIESRVERWSVDEETRTARLTGSYGSTPAVRTLVGGSVQSISPSRTLVSFGTEGRVEEYDATGTVQWRLEGAPGYVFRAQRFRSLYKPGCDTPR
jgi:hypothetical protein